MHEKCSLAKKGFALAQFEGTVQCDSEGMVTGPWRNRSYLVHTEKAESNEC